MHLSTKMFRYSSMIGVVNLLLFTCAIAPDTTEAPWIEASFVNPIATDIKFTNNGPLTREFSARIQDYPQNLRASLPDSLGPGESITLTLELPQPHYVFYESEYNITLRIILPGLDRSLTHNDIEVIESGPHALEYNYLDEVLLPLNIVGRQPPTGIDLISIQRSWFEKSITHLDTVPVPTGMPEYIHPLLFHTLQLASYFEGLAAHNYNLFFLHDTIAVPAVMMDSLETLLAKTSYYQSPSYTAAFTVFAQVKGEIYHNPEFNTTSNIMTARARAYNTFPIPERQADATASHLADLVTDQRVYLNKSQNIEMLKASLPEPYRIAVAEIERSNITSSASNDGLRNLLNQEWQIPEGTNRIVGVESKSQFRLLKFWFAGCVPCILEQPYEQELLATHPEVELIYFAHSTNFEKWKSYLDNHRPPTTMHYLIPKTKTKAVVAAAGTTGAPTYVLVDSEGKQICQPCPKPSDPLLEEIISQF